jgi:2-C-methyl-D-erythritol 4-phosphate cytidylyltransferase
MGHDIPKQFLPLEGVPVLGLTLDVFESCAEIDRILVVSAPDWIEETRRVVEKHCPVKCDTVLPGGATRQESSRIGFSALADWDDATVVLVHDAVRPFVTHEIIDRCVEAVRECGAADVVVSAVDTIVQGEQDFITTVPERQTMFQGQTPQGFKLGVLKRAHERAREDGVTNASDDVRLALRIGQPVKLVMGSYENIKLTHPMDVELAKLLLAKRREATECR